MRMVVISCSSNWSSASRPTRACSAGGTARPDRPGCGRAAARVGRAFDTDTDTVDDPYIGDELVALTVHGADDVLTFSVVANRLAGRFDSRGQR